MVCTIGKDGKMQADQTGHGVTIFNDPIPVARLDSGSLVKGDECIRTSYDSKAVHHSMGRTGPSEFGPLWFVCDYVNSNTGWRSIYVGGNWDNTSNAGVANANANNSLDNSNSNIGARLAYPSEVYSIIILGKDPASWQKTKTNDSRRTGRCAHGCGHPNVGSRSICSRGAPSS
jgi:hypothetical protein